MNQASRNVLSQLDKVDNDVIDFFVPAAERLMTSESPARVLAAALASMSGFRKPPRPRSLLTYEEGLMTLRILGGTGMDGFAGLTKVLAAICKKGHIAKVRGVGRNRGTLRDGWLCRPNRGIGGHLQEGPHR